MELVRKTFDEIFPDPPSPEVVMSDIGKQTAVNYYNFHMTMGAEFCLPLGCKIEAEAFDHWLRSSAFSAGRMVDKAMEDLNRV